MIHDLSLRHAVHMLHALLLVIEHTTTPLSTRYVFSMSYYRPRLFISHDLKVVRALANELIVMRQGKVVEQGSARAIFESPKEAYTRALMSAAFDLEASERDAVAS